MEEIWTDQGLTRSFRAAFEDWTDAVGGSVQNVSRSAIFCEFPARTDRVGMRVGLYHADGRRTLRLDTVREELELAMVNKYAVDGDRLVVQSDKGSRRFELDAGAAEWTIEKRSV